MISDQYQYLIKFEWQHYKFVYILKMFKYFQKLQNMSSLMKAVQTHTGSLARSETAPLFLTLQLPPSRRWPATTSWQRPGSCAASPRRARRPTRTSRWRCRRGNLAERHSGRRDSTGRREGESGGWGATWNGVGQFEVSVEQPHALAVQELVGRHDFSQHASAQPESLQQLLEGLAPWKMEVKLKYTGTTVSHFMLTQTQPEYDTTKA